MSTTETPTELLIQRPKRADARRNYEKVLAAARQAFAEGGESTSLEEIARRAGVGIGTLYRNFPNRQALLDALYLDEVEEVCRSAADLDDVEFSDVLQMVVGIGKLPTADPSQIEHIIRVALDGLRYKG